MRARRRGTGAVPGRSTRSLDCFRDLSARSLGIDRLRDHRRHRVGGVGPIRATRKPASCSRRHRELARCGCFPARNLDSTARSRIFWAAAEMGRMRGANTSHNRCSVCRCGGARLYRVDRDERSEMRLRQSNQQFERTVNHRRPSLGAQAMVRPAPATSGVAGRSTSR